MICRTPVPVTGLKREPLTHSHKTYIPEVPLLFYKNVYTEGVLWQRFARVIGVHNSQLPLHGSKYSVCTTRPVTDEILLGTILHT